MKKINLIIVLFLVSFIIFSSLTTYANSNDISYYDENATLFFNDNEEITIVFDNNTITYKYLDIYYVNNENIENTFYVADSLKNYEENSKIVFLAIYYDINTYEYTQLNINVFYADTKKFYNLHATINQSIKNHIIKDFMLFDDISDDKIIDRIKESSYIYSEIQTYLNKEIMECRNLNEANLEQNSLIIPNVENRSISDTNTYNLNQINTTGNYISGSINYDAYTNSDDYITNYETTHYNIWKDENGNITDNDIVNIIPKELCFQVGQYMYIGREYGFFVKTIVDGVNPSDFSVDVVIFDIERVYPNFANYNYSGFVKVTHLFQHKYRAVDKERRGNMWDGFDPDLDKVVYPHFHSDLIDYYIRNIAIRHSLENEILLNEGDEGYSASNDEGAFFSVSYFEYEATGLKKFEGNFIEDTIELAFGFVDPTNGIASYIASLAQYETISTKVENCEKNVQIYAPNRYYQLEEYQKLLKQINVKPDLLSEEPMMFGLNDYFTSNYIISYYDQAVPTRIIDSIYLEIGLDESNLILGLIPTGDFNTLAFSESYYSSSKKTEFLVNHETSSSIDYYGDSAYYKFVPEYSGDYIFETRGSTDTFIRLFDDDLYEIDHNDDDGEGNNALLFANLVRGNTYYIKVQGFNNSRIGAFNFFIKYDIYNATQITKDISVNVNINNSYTIKLLKFVPTTSGVYNIYTSNNSGDPQLYLYNISFNQIDFDDDGLPSNNSILEVELDVGNTYYILAKCYSSTIGTFTVNIEQLEEEHQHTFTRYKSYSNTQHKAICGSCGDFVLQYHMLTNGSCVLCGYSSSLHNITTNNSLLLIETKTYITENGTYVTDNGVIYLSELDYQLFLNDKLDVYALVEHSHTS